MRQNRLRDNIRAFFQSDHRGAVAVYLFGSAARGTDGPKSDIDLGVLYREGPPRSLDGACHGYDDVDMTIVRELMETRLDDLLRFVECLRKHLPAS